MHTLESAQSISALRERLEALGVGVFAAACTAAGERRKCEGAVGVMNAAVISFVRGVDLSGSDYKVHPLSSQNDIFKRPIFAPIILVAFCACAQEQAFRY